MITAQSTPEQIRKELYDDERRSFYWFAKQHHGDKGLEKWRLEQCKQLYKKGGKEWFSEPVEYSSPNGNRWLSYEHISRDGQGGFFSFTYSICYYETVGSVGAYVRCDTENAETGEKIPGCLHFTTHFFQRFAERMGLEFRSRTMMLRFLQLAHHHVVIEKKPRPGYKDTEIVMRYPASFAFGTKRDVDGYRITTIRTFMPVTMLTPSKKRELQEFGAFSDEMSETIALNILKRKKTPQIKLFEL